MVSHSEVGPVALWGTCMLTVVSAVLPADEISAVVVFPVRSTLEKLLGVDMFERSMVAVLQSL